MRAPRSRSPRHTQNMTPVQRREVHTWVEENFAPDQHLGGDDGQHVKRPLNAFMLYKKHKLDTRHSEGAGDSIDADVSGKEHLCARIAGMWKALTDSERAVWYERAREWKRRHEEAFPGYKYIPRRGKHLPASAAAPISRTSPESPQSPPRSTISTLFPFSPECRIDSCSPSPACMSSPRGWTPEAPCGPLTNAMPVVPFMAMTESFSAPAPTFFGYTALPEPIFDLQDAAPGPGSMWWPPLYTNTLLPSPIPSESEECLPAYDSECVPGYDEACAPAQPQAIGHFLFDAPFGTDLQQQQPPFGPIYETLPPQLILGY